MAKRTRTKDGADGPPQPTYFLALAVENVRCFGPKQRLDLSDGHGRPARWTVILGDNGTGKTTLLRTLVNMIPRPWPSHRPQDESPGCRAILQPFVVSGEEESPLARNDAGVALFEAEYVYGSPLSSRDGPFQKAFLSYRTMHDINRYDYDSPAPIEEMVVIGYGANRPGGAGSLSEYHPDGTRNLTVENSPLIPAEEWLLQQDLLARHGNGDSAGARHRLDAVIRLLKDLLPKDDIEDISFKAIDLSPSRQRIAVHVKTPYGEVQLRGLSLGYRTLISWTIDLAMQLFARYPHSKNPLHEPAVVLVDEIDLHLHPKWQRQLFTSLAEKFCNAQFIVTAHSPLIVQAAGADANIVVLRRSEGANHVVIDPAPDAVHSWRVDQILTSDLYGLPSARSPELDEKYARRRELLRKPKLTKKEKAELEALEAWLVTQPGGENPEEMSFWNTLRDVTSRLQAKRERSS